MIVWYERDVPVGTRVVGIWDFNKEWHNQPAIVIRKATAEEYVQYYESTGRKAGDKKYLVDKFFYEISTD